MRCLFIALLFLTLPVFAETYDEWYLFSSDKQLNLYDKTCAQRTDEYVAHWDKVYPDSSHKAKVISCIEGNPAYGEYYVLDAEYYRFTPSPECPEGQVRNSAGECVPASSEDNYCDTPAAQQAIEDGIRSCPNQSGSGTCNRDTQQIEVTCDKEPGGEEPNPEEPNPEEPKPEDPNDLCNTEPKPAFCEESDADGGGEGGSGEDGDGGGVEGVSEFCKEHPELCPPYEEPNPEEPQDETDLIAAIAKITKKLNDQHRTQIENRVNTTNITTNTAKQLDKSETIKNNTKVIADNTDKATDHLKAVDERMRNSNRLLTQNARDLDSRLKQINDTIKSKGVGQGSGSGGGGGSDLPSMEGNAILREIRDELKKGFCDKNKDHPSCITEVKGNAYKGILGDSDIAKIKSKADEVRKEINTKMESFKKLLGNPNLPHGGAISPVEFTLTHQGRSVRVKQDSFNQVGSMTKNIVIAICSVLALMIVVRN